MNAPNVPTDRQDDRAPDNWSACEEGTLGGLNKRLRVARAKRVGGLVGGSVGAVVAVLAVALWPANAQPPGGITCAECAALIPAYHAELTGGESLAAEESQSVVEHLEVCPKCQNYFEGKYPGVLAAATSTASLGLISFALLGSRVRQRRG